MSKKRRQQCESCIYHLTVRGVAKQVIFEDEEDKRFFGTKLRQYLRECKVDLYAWCIMSNHVHLLVMADIQTISRFMRRLLTSYGRYFNTRYDRVGHLFQERYDSVPVCTDEQLMTAVRYIHRNPEEIPGQSYKSYKWSSYREYLGCPFVSKTHFVMTVFNDLDEFVRFHESWNSTDCKPKPTNFRKAISDEEAIALVKTLLAIDSVTSIASCEKIERNKQLATLKKAGLPITQIARISGIGRNIVQRAGK